ncbi:MAG: XRE family transcriptional regulator [Flexilinea sp.]
MAKVNPIILRWARETAGYTVEEAAANLGFNDTKSMTAVEKLEAIERGDDEPSKAVLYEMADKYHRSLLVLYLSKVPKKHEEVADFRIFQTELSPIEKGWTDALVRDILVRQSIIKDVLEEEENFIPLDFVESLTMNMGKSSFIYSIIDKLGFNLKQFRKERNSTEAFKYLRTCVESAGIYVLLVSDLGNHTRPLSISLFRGFTLADKFAPFIVINSNDAKGSWSFTLLHELVHLWLGQNSISNGNIQNETERFCDDIAGEILLPGDELQNLNGVDTSNLEVFSEIVSGYAIKRKISSTMVAYKLLRKKIIDNNQYELLAKNFYERWRLLKDEEREKNRKKDSGGPIYTVLKQNEAGRGLVLTVRTMIDDGSLTVDRASKVLGVHARNVYKVLEV